MFGNVLGPAFGVRSAINLTGIEYERVSDKLMFWRILGAGTCACLDIPDGIEWD